MRLLLIILFFSVSAFAQSTNYWGRAEFGNKIGFGAVDNAAFQRANKTMTDMDSLWHGRLNYDKGTANILYKLSYKNFIYNFQKSVDTVRIGLIFDSIGGTMVTAFMDTLEWYFPDVPIKWYEMIYGGYSWVFFDKIIEANVLYTNLDWVIISEYEGGQRSELSRMENAVRLIKTYTTADISLGTWTYSENANQAVSDSCLQFTRDLALKYNCGLIDFNYKMRGVVNNTDYTMDDLTSDGLHPNLLGHKFLAQEFNSHIDTSKLGTYYTTNVFYDVEEIIYLPNALKFEHEPDNINLYGDWSISKVAGPRAIGYSIVSTTQNDSFTVDFTGVGFDFYYEDQVGYGDFDLFVDGVKPSTITVDGYPLTYASEVKWIDNSTLDEKLHRLFKVQVLDTTAIGRYWIHITNGATGAFRVDDPFGNSIGVGDWDADFTSGNGDIKIPVFYTGIDSNWLGVGGILTADSFYFDVRNNWVDDFDGGLASNHVLKIRVFGLENKKHNLKIVVTEAKTVRFGAIKVFRPPLGRQ